MGDIIVPSYAGGFARNRAEAKYPELWRGLVGAWLPFLGLTGSTLRDISGYHNHGTLTNMDPPTDWIISEMGPALAFDGENDYVDCGDVEVAEDQVFTFLALLRSTEEAADQWVISRGNTLSDTPIIGLTKENLKLRCYLRSDDGSSSDIEGNTTIVDSAWHLVAATCDGSLVRIYVDGKEDGSVAASGSVTTLNTSTLCALKRAAVGQYMTGDLGLAAIWNRALSAQENAFFSANPYALAELRTVSSDGFRVWFPSQEITDVGGIASAEAFGSPEVLARGVGTEVYRGRSRGVLALFPWIETGTTFIRNAIFRKG